MGRTFETDTRRTKCFANREVTNLSIVLPAILAFISTNIDNIIVVTVLLATATSSATKRKILSSQYISLIILVILSFAGSLLINLISLQYTSILGLIPIALGIKTIFDNRKRSSALLQNPEAEHNRFSSDNTSGLLTFVMLALSNGMDNIGVYVPMFTNLVTGWDIIVISLIFIVMMTVLCFICGKIAGLPVVNDKIQKHAVHITPVVYVLLGIYIIVR